MLIKCLLLAIWSGICSIDSLGAQIEIRKSLLAGTVAGIICGDLTTGLIVGGTLELLFMGAISVGGSTPPNAIAGSIVGTAVAALSGGGVEAGLLIAVPVATLAQTLQVFRNMGFQIFIPMMDKAVETGDFNKPLRVQLLGALYIFIWMAVPVFLGCYIGVSATDAIMNFIPAWLNSGLKVMTGLLPAVGIAMLMTILVKGDNWFYLVIGLAFANYLGLSLTAMSVIGVGFAALHLYLTEKNNSENAVVNNEEGEYDL